MQRNRSTLLHTAAALISALLACTPAYADQDKSSQDNGHGKADQHEREGRRGDYHAEPRGDRRDDRHVGNEQPYFTAGHRVIVHQYYAGEFAHGRCPPGLAKKRNGCMPPGLARRWVLGQPLPREVVYYALPPAVSINLGRPPAGAHYVRVANDILLVAVGTGMVLDALTDLSGR